MARVLLPLIALACVAAVLVGGFIAILKLERKNDNLSDPLVALNSVGIPLEDARPSNIRPDERVIFFPTVARLSEDGERWVVPIHAWVFEPEEGALVRGAVISGLAKSLGLDKDAAANEIFRERAAWFLVDNERSKRLTIVVGGRALELEGTTGPEGHLYAEIELPAGAIHEGIVSYSALEHRDNPPRVFGGSSRLLGRTGLTVISDIDDTVKVSHVTDKKKLLAKTFTEPFEAAPGMAERYRKLADDGAAFIYVSSSPWQLYPVLSEGLAAPEFPHTPAFHLKTFRLKDKRVFDLTADPFEAKVARIESIIAAHPQRDYILVGDTGERDPEVYAAIAQAHPRGVKRVMLRNVTEESLDNERLSSLYDDIDAPVELIDP